jgi:hypothetical protein
MLQIHHNPTRMVIFIAEPVFWNITDRSVPTVKYTLTINAGRPYARWFWLRWSQRASASGSKTSCRSGPKRRIIALTTREIQGCRKDRDRQNGHRDMEERVAINLEQSWLPRLRDLKQSRQRTIRFIELILIVLTSFVILLLGSFSYNAINNNFQLSAGLGFLAFLVGLLLFIMKILSTMQGCNDALVAIECYVYMRDDNGLTGALVKIECLGHLRELLDDYGKLTKLVR